MSCDRPKTMKSKLLSRIPIPPWRSGLGEGRKLAPVWNFRRRAPLSARAKAMALRTKGGECYRLYRCSRRSGGTGILPVPPEGRELLIWVRTTPVAGTLARSR
jgi:hypothetical protein